MLSIFKRKPSKVDTMVAGILKYSFGEDAINWDWEYLTKLEKRIIRSQKDLDTIKKHYGL